MNRYLKISAIHFTLALVIVAWWVMGCVPKTIQGDCVPRAFFNATSWTIVHRSPVVVADFLGHWQAVGVHEGEPHFLRSHGWEVWPGDREGNKPIAKLWTLREAMEHFIKHNPWSTPSKEQMEYWNRRIKGEGVK